MLRLALLMLRDRPSRAVATFIAFWCGALIITVGASILESGSRLRASPERYAGVDAVVAVRDLPVTFTDDEGAVEVQRVLLPEGGRIGRDLTDQLAAVPGVAAVVPEVSIAIASPTRQPLPTRGYGWSSAELTPFRLTSGDAPAGDGEVVLGAGYARATGLGPGDRVPLRAGGQVREYTVAGVAQPQTPMTRQLTVFFTTAEVTRLAGNPTGADAVGVRFADGADRDGVLAGLRTVAERSGARVSTGTDRGFVEQPLAATAREFTIAFGGTFVGYAALVTMIVAASTIGLSVRSRYRDIALLRAIAATPRQVRWLVLAEGVLLAAVAGVTALPFGRLAAGVFGHELIEREIVPEDFVCTAGAVTVAVVLGAVLGTAVVASWAASRRTSRIRPTEALGEAAAEPDAVGWKRAFWGVLSLAAGTGLAVLARTVPGDAAVGGALGLLFTLTIAVSFLAPWINRLAARLCAGPLIAVWKASGYLAAANLRSGARRMAPVLTSMVLAVGLGGSVWFLQTNLERETTGQYRDGTVADRLIVGGDLGVPPEVVPAVRALPGVTAATGVHRTAVVIRRFGDVDTYPAQAVDPEELARTMDLGVRAGSLDDLGAGTVAIAEQIAEHLRYGVGDDITLWLGDGTRTRLRVVAVYARGLGFGDLTMARSVVAGHTASRLDDLVLVRTGGDTDRGAALADLVAGFPGTAVTDPAALGRELSTQVRTGTWTNQVFVGVLIAYVVIAAANTLVMAALSRERELSVLRLVGVTRRQVLAMVRAEQVALLGVALLIGGAIAALALSSIVTVATGRAVPYVPPLGWVCVLGGATVLALVAAVLPVHALLRTDPVEGIGVRE